jgi:hypothetical protein
MKGTDGLYFYQNQLIGIQNGIFPNRVIALKLDKSQSQATDYQILENNHPEFNEPTLGTIVRNTLYYVANSCWNCYDKNDQQFTEDKLKETIIMQIDLKNKSQKIDKK